MSVASPARQNRIQRSNPAPNVTGGERSGRRSDGRKSTQEQLVALAAPALFANLTAVVVLFMAAGGLAKLDTLTDWFLMSGRLSGLVATNLVLVQLFLMSRNPWIDRVLGRDKLTAYHRVVGQSSFYLILAHIVFTVLAYSRLGNLTFLGQSIELVVRTKWMLFAAASFVCFVMVVVSSIRAARKVMQYETWHFIHFYAYLAIALALPHQMFTGGTFAQTPLAILYWTTAYVAAVGSVGYFRFGVPLMNHRRYAMKVSNVIRESDDTISIYITGNNLSDLNAQAGQYFNWRFLDRDNWTAAHPFSLSAAPPPTREHPRQVLRITVKQTGLGTRKLEHIDVGTPVMAEGPYGAFTPEVRTQRRVLLVAGGVGVTPIRALLEGLPARAGDISMIYRAHSQNDLVLIDEIRELTERRRVFLHVVLGGRDEFPPDFPPLGADHLHHVAPDIVDRDVYVCGSVALTQFVVEALTELQVPPRQVHYESFSV